MKYNIFHRLEYSYESSVNLGPQIIYLQPKHDSFCEIEDYQLEIFPPISKISTHSDAEGNSQQIATFDSPTSILILELKATINLTSFNPFDFFYVPKESQKIPFKYNKEQQIVLQPYLLNQPTSKSIQLISNQLYEKANGYTSAFLMEVNKYIFEEFEYQIREEGFANEATETLENKKGSCRDFAVLFASICQAQGLATRFVSGYYVGQPAHKEAPDQSHNLHAWVEVFLPGGGWRGFDPTQNEVVCGHHVSLASSYDLSLIPPLKGYFNGSAKSNLKTTVAISLVDQ